MKTGVSTIIVGTRHRKEMGDIQGLATDIGKNGLLHPIVIRPDGRLIAGERRLRAVQLLGWTEVPVNIVDISSIVRGELAENSQRKDFLPSEMVAISAAIEDEEQIAARARQGTRTDLELGGKLPPSEKGKARDKTAARVGTSGKTLQKAKAIVEAAKAEPEKYGKLVEQMDDKQRVDGPFKRLQNMKAAEAIRAEPPPLPGNGPYRVIVADPPWAYETDKPDPSARSLRPYPSMTLAQICDLDVASLAEEDTILWLWTTNFHMPHAYDVASAWGFKPITILTWAKDKWGYGHYLREQTEHALFCIKGKPIVEGGDISTLLVAPMGEHSAKPDAFYELVEKLCPAPRYAELFGRRTRPGWDGHGNEIPTINQREVA